MSESSLAFNSKLCTQGLSLQSRSRALWTSILPAVKTKRRTDKSMLVESVYVVKMKSCRRPEQEGGTPKEHPLSFGIVPLRHHQIVHRTVIGAVLSDGAPRYVAGAIVWSSSIDIHSASEGLRVDDVAQLLRKRPENGWCG